MTEPTIEVLVTSDCPHAAPALALVREVAGVLAPGAEVARVEIGTSDEAATHAFWGSPSVRVAGRDVEGGDPPPGVEAGILACRHYGADGGVPPRWRIEAAILGARRPQHLLFLCVANSARSQMAEGIARALAPAGVRVSSAGSAPTSVRPEAVAALAALDIDISGQRSKAVGEIDLGEVDAVFTLCAEEECPVVPAAGAARLAWTLPDPAGVPGGADRAASFAHVRDELRRRLESLFAAYDPAS